MNQVNELYERFEEFVEYDWEVDMAYSIVDFRELFDIDIRLARYYLVKFVDLGELFCLKWGRDVYYMKSYWQGPFEVFAGMKDVKIVRGYTLCRSTRRN